MHWDGRLVLGAMAVNWAAGLLSALVLLAAPGSTALAWVHVLLFCGMPVAGFVWFLRDTVSWRGRGQVAVSLVFQAFLALLPWLFSCSHCCGRLVERGACALAYQSTSTTYRWPFGCLLFAGHFYVGAYVHDAKNPLHLR